MPARTRFERWAAELIEEAESGSRDKLDVVRFLEGSHPTEPPPTDDQETKPRITIPGSPGHKGGPKAKGRTRKWLSPP